MGQKRYVAIDLTQEEEQQAPKKPAPRPKADQPKADVVSAPGKDTSHLVDEETPTPEPKTTKKASKVKPEVKVSKISRSRRYQAARAKVDRTKTYPLEEAIKLLKKTNLARFDASVDAHLTVTETGLKASVTFPHSTGKTTKVAIADDKLIEQITTGKIDFDVLLSTPAMMPKLAKVAKILGPKGLMPSPKSGTITQDPEKTKAELAGGKTLVKTEAKAPLIHISVGKISLKDDHLAANIQALITGLTPKNITKLTLATSMSPGVKVDLTTTSS